MRSDVWKRSGGRRGQLVYIGMTLALAVVFSLIFYTCNSPLGPAVGSDNAMYLTMGTALARGYAPYTQIFDHKGPLLFILQAIPQLFTSGYSTLAVFVQEVLFLFACLLVLGRMARRTGVSRFAVQMIYLAVYARLTDGGNLTEEYSNLFTLIGLDAMLSVFDDGDGLGGRDARALFRPALALGVTAMLSFMLRANNVLVTVCAVGAVALCMLPARRFAQLGVCALGVLAGCALAAAPIVAWLMRYGVLGDAFYGAIIHNMMYADTGDVPRSYMLFHMHYGHYAIFIAVLTCLGALAYYIRTRRIPLALAMMAGAAAGGFAAFISHKFYYHYQMLAVPMAALGGMQLLALFGGFGARGRRAAACAACAVCALWLGVYGADVNAVRRNDHAVMQNVAHDALALYDQVPETERDSFLAYRVEPKWYVGAEALPCMRFYFLQEILAQADPMVMDEIVHTFETEPPKWIVLFYNREFGPPYDARMAEIFEKNYAFVDAVGEYQLLRLKAE
ncbi:MAG: hypothetical protein IJD60_08445 [Clostridia bacterium]|nr:hypothetical protein [Clostridia bacterium]